ncbi:MAG: hypothetical protein OXU53_10830 [Deltaproteobacteria bacterium]|nr:hypothetical protein [Deltaproteobacteria bacterium]
MSRQVRPEPTLADHGATMAMLRKRAGGDEAALAEVEEWGRRRERRLPVLRRFVALLAEHGIIGPDTHRIDRNFVVIQCFAIATRHGLDMMDYRYRDSRSGPLTALMGVDLHAVELGEGETAGLFPDAASERAFLDEIAEKDDEELGRMARDAVIPGRERLVFP